MGDEECKVFVGKILGRHRRMRDDIKINLKGTGHESTEFM